MQSSTDQEKADFYLPAIIFSDVAFELKRQGHGNLIGADGVIRLGTVPIKRQGPPRLDDNGIGPRDETADAV